MTKQIKEEFTSELKKHGHSVRSACRLANKEHAHVSRILNGKSISHEYLNDILSAIGSDKRVVVSYSVI